MALVRLLVKQLLADTATSGDFTRGSIFESERAFATAKGHLTSDRGIGRDLIQRVLGNMPGMTLNNIKVSLERLKASGDYARNIKAIAGIVDSEEAVQAVTAVAQSDYGLLCCMVDENLTQQHIVPKTIFEIVSAAIKEAEKMLRASRNVHDFNAGFKRSRGLETLLQKSNGLISDQCFSLDPEYYSQAKLAIEPSGEGLGRRFLQHFLPPHTIANNNTLQTTITAYYQEEWRKEGDRLAEASQRLLQAGKTAEAQELEKQGRAFFDSWLERFSTWDLFVQALRSESLPEFWQSADIAITQVTSWLGGAAAAPFFGELLQKSQCSARNNVNSWRRNEYEKARLLIIVAPLVR